MLALRLGDVSDFPFVGPPAPKMINDGFTLLTELGAVDEIHRALLSGLLGNIVFKTEVEKPSNDKKPSFSKKQVFLPRNI